MPTINQNENLIRVDPPIQWDEIQGGPPLSELEMAFDGPEAVGIRAVSGARIDSHLDRAWREEGVIRVQPTDDLSAASPEGIVDRLGLTSIGATLP